MAINSSSSPNDTRVAWIISIGFLAAALVPSLAFGGQTPPRAVTFTKDIAPILQRSCENCHRTNGVAPIHFTPRVTWLTEEQFKEKVAERANKRVISTAAQPE